MAPPSTPKVTTGRKTKVARIKRSKSTTPTLEGLEKAKAAGKAQFSRAQGTRKKYDGNVARGKDFLARLVAGRRQKCLIGESGGGYLKDDINTDELEKAFDETGPNQYSPIALEYFITQKCFAEDRGEPTASAIHASFCDYWDHMRVTIYNHRSGNDYAGPYKYDKTTGTTTGCPARAVIITRLLKIVKVKDGTKGAAAQRHHAEAMRVEQLATIMKWSASEYPALCTGSPYTTPPALRHIEMRAFLSTGFTLWTRNFETCGLQRQDLLLDCRGGEPLYLPYIQVRLENRKGWQNKQGWNGPLENNTYNIYHQSNWEMDMYSHLEAWLTILTQQIGRPLAPDDYIFPYISPNGLINPKAPMTHDVVQSLLSEFSLGAGLDQHFTTHSLRRGGAQYRLMFAPLGERWSLSIIRWWGGWAIGEQASSLCYENGYNDALCPTRLDSSKTFMGEGDLTRTATIHDIHVLVSAVVTALSPSSTAPLTPTITAPGVTNSSSPLHETASNPAPISSSAVPSSSQAMSTSPAEFNPAPVSSSAASSSSRAPVTSVSTGDSTGLMSGVFIPNLSCKKGSWKEAVVQWEEGNPMNNILPLKDWPKEMYTGVMREKVAAKRHSRKLIAEEYQRLGRNDVAFEALYGNAKGQAAMIKTIRANLKAQGLFGVKSRKSRLPAQHSNSSRSSSPAMFGVGN